jgi:hypothetical protein
VEDIRGLADERNQTHDGAFIRSDELAANRPDIAGRTAARRDGRLHSMDGLASLSLTEQRGVGTIVANDLTGYHRTPFPTPHQNAPRRQSDLRRLPSSLH